MVFCGKDGSDKSESERKNVVHSKQDPELYHLASKLNMLQDCNSTVLKVEKKSKDWMILEHKRGKEKNIEKFGKGAGAG